MSLPVGEEALARVKDETDPLEERTLAGTGTGVDLDAKASSKSFQISLTAAWPSKLGICCPGAIVPCGI